MYVFIYHVSIYLSICRETPNSALQPLTPLFTKNKSHKKDGHPKKLVKTLFFSCQKKKHHAHHCKLKKILVSQHHCRHPGGLGAPTRCPHVRICTLVPEDIAPDKQLLLVFFWLEGRDFPNQILDASEIVETKYFYGFFGPMPPQKRKKCTLGSFMITTTTTTIILDDDDQQQQQQQQQQEEEEEDDTLKSINQVPVPPAKRHRSSFGFFSTMGTGSSGSLIQWDWVPLTIRGVPMSLGVPGKSPARLMNVGGRLVEWTISKVKGSEIHLQYILGVAPSQQECEKMKVCRNPRT